MYHRYLVRNFGNHLIVFFDGLVFRASNTNRQLSVPETIRRNLGSRWLKSGLTNCDYPVNNYCYNQCDVSIKSENQRTSTWFDRLKTQRLLDVSSLVLQKTSATLQLRFDLRVLGQLARRWHERLFTKPLAKVHSASPMYTCPGFETTSAGQPSGPVAEPSVHFSSRPTALTKYTLSIRNLRHSRSLT